MTNCCWRPVAHQQPVRTDGTRRPEPDNTGLITLASYPESTKKHSGEYRAKTVYLVGYDTEHERLFRHDDAKAAVAYKNGIDRNLPFDRFVAGNMPDDAIADLYG